MLITRKTVGDKLLAYLNHEMTLAMLVDWAERTFMDDTLAPDSDVDLLNDVLMYIAAADTPQFPLTWEVCTDFMTRLGMAVPVILSA